MLSHDLLWVTEWPGGCNLIIDFGGHVAVLSRIASMLSWGEDAQAHGWVELSPKCLVQVQVFLEAFCLFFTIKYTYYWYYHIFMCILNVKEIKIIWHTYSKTGAFKNSIMLNLWFWMWTRFIPTLKKPGLLGHVWFSAADLFSCGPFVQKSLLGQQHLVCCLQITLDLSALSC